MATSDAIPIQEIADLRRENRLLRERCEVLADQYQQEAELRYAAECDAAWLKKKLDEAQAKQVAWERDEVNWP